MPLSGSILDAKNSMLIPLNVKLLNVKTTYTSFSQYLSMFVVVRVYTETKFKARGTDKNQAIFLGDATVRIFMYDFIWTEED